MQYTIWWHGSKSIIMTFELTEECLFNYNHYKNNILFKDPRGDLQKVSILPIQHFHQINSLQKNA